jgi:uncharacterized RDD family membrane protein YckC
LGIQNYRYFFAGVVGLISMIVSKNNQRLGDIASGTAVISLKTTSIFLILFLKTSRKIMFLLFLR